MMNPQAQLYLCYKKYYDELIETVSMWSTIELDKASMNRPLPYISIYSTPQELCIVSFISQYYNVYHVTTYTIDDSIISSK